MSTRVGGDKRIESLMKPPRVAIADVIHLISRLRLPLIFLKLLKPFYAEVDYFISSRWRLIVGELVLGIGSRRLSSIEPIALG